MPIAHDRLVFATRCPGLCCTCAQAKDGLGYNDEPQRPAAVAAGAGPGSQPGVGGPHTGVSRPVPQQQEQPVAQEAAWEPEGGFGAVAADPSDTALTEVARRVFGFAGFRGLQLPVIQRVLAGQSTLAIMPTGALPIPQDRLRKLGPSPYLST